MTRRSGPATREPAGPAAAAAAVAGVLALLEALRPYFFLQDDNRDQFLPFFVHDWRALASGTVALFNWRQYLGVPHLAAGQTAVLYPPVYLAVGASRLLWGHPFAAIDLLVALHLCAGAWGMWRLARRLSGSADGAWLASAAWALGSFALVGSQFWQTVSAAAAFMPWLVELSLRLLERARPRDAALLAAAHALFFFTGYVEFFLYICLCEGAFAALSGAWRRAAPAGRRLWAAAAALGLLLAAPLLLPLLQASAASALRAAALPAAEQARDDVPPLAWALGLLWPAARAPGASFFRAQLCALSFLGWPVLLLLARGALRFRGRASREGAAMAALAAAALAWAFGWLDPALRVLPLLGRFRFHFKLLLPADFFLILLAARELTALGRPRWARAAVAVQLAGAAFWAAALPPQGPLIDTSPPPLAEPARALLQDGRVASLGPLREGPVRRAPLLGFDYATLWGLEQVAGYDPLVPRRNYERALYLDEDALLDPAALASPEALEQLRHWGARWYVVERASAPDYAPFLARAGAVLRSQDPDRLIFEDARALPLAYWRGGGAAGLSRRLRPNALELSIDSPGGGEVVVNALRQPGLALTLDGAPAPFAVPLGDQPSFEVPPGRHLAVLRYEEPAFQLGLALAACGALAALGAAARLRAR